MKTACCLFAHFIDHCGSSGFCLSEGFAGGGSGHGASDLVFPMSLDSYEPLEAAKAAKTGDELNLWQVLVVRATADPINLVATLLFFGAILHTFAAGHFMKLAHKYEAANKVRSQTDSRRYVLGKDVVESDALSLSQKWRQFSGGWYRYWHIVFQYGWDTPVIDTRNYVEPMFVVVIMALSRPVVLLPAIPWHVAGRASGLRRHGGFPS